jgi:signal peptidase I
MGQAKSKPARPEPSVPATPPKGTLSILREWTDALVIAFLLAMFIRTFVVELFKIPSGSMTPTLVGTGFNPFGQPEERVLEWDVNKDGEKDLILDRNHNRYPRYHVFFRKNGKFVGNEEFATLNLPLEAIRSARIRNDRIVVNKFIFWFRRPRRGEIVVFRVPFGPPKWQRDKPIYIKRLVGLPGETVEIRQPHVYINGQLLDRPEVFQRTEYTNAFDFRSATVPPHSYLVLGDNSKNSMDSRDWGTVPENNLKGLAVLRYWPLDTIGLLHRESGPSK